MKTKSSNTIIITGAPGQDAYYLTKHLIGKYNIVLTYKNFDSYKRKKLPFDVRHNILDITNYKDCQSLIANFRPFAVINCAAMSSVAACNSNPPLAINANYIGVTNLLQSIYACSQHSRFINLSSKEIFGSCFDIKDGKKVQTEKTCHKPLNVYGLSKAAAFDATSFYRRKNIFASSAILYTHESILRPETFFFRKACNWFKSYKEFVSKARIKDVSLFPLGKLKLGSLNTHFDICHASDVCAGIIKILEYEAAGDFILASGKNISAVDLLRRVALVTGVENIDNLYEVDESLVRECTVTNNIVADIGYTYYKLNWLAKTALDDIIKEIVNV